MSEEWRSQSRQQSPWMLHGTQVWLKIKVTFNFILLDRFDCTIWVRLSHIPVFPTVWPAFVVFDRPDFEIYRFDFLICPIQWSILSPVLRPSKKRQNWRWRVISHFTEVLFRKFSPTCSFTDESSDASTALRSQLTSELPDGAKVYYFGGKKWENNYNINKVTAIRLISQNTRVSRSVYVDPACEADPSSCVVTADVEITAEAEIETGGEGKGNAIVFRLF